MSKSLVREIKHNAEDSLEDLANALHRAADGLTDDAEHAVAAAAKALRDAATMIGNNTPEPAKAVARKAAAEVKAHPIASTAALLTAAAALIGLLASTRQKTTK
ncbi:hypothetical protein [Phenylobacterium sp.]|jgi:hypothetical protein|uniref:hypothetical protein n=1 Tax=Phenylobacterium sp. TaxID=1871053 RepID=UPI0037C883F7